MKKRILLVLAVALIVAVTFGGYYCLHKTESISSKPNYRSSEIALNPSVPKEYKTYKSSYYGFSLYYPKDWILEEDEYERKTAGLKTGEASFFLFNDKDINMAFSKTSARDYSNDELAAFINHGNSKEEIRQFVKRFNVISDIEGIIRLKISGEKWHIIYGTAQINSEKKYVLAILFRSDRSELIFIHEKIGDSIKFQESLSNFLEVLTWIRFE